jgi:hypothetical protein
MRSLAGQVFFAAMALLATSCPTFSSSICTVDYEFIGYASTEGRSTFWILERTGRDCSGSHLLRLDVAADSVAATYVRDWEDSPDIVLGNEFQGAWDSRRFDRAVGQHLEFHGHSISVSAPDSLLGDQVDLLLQREPTLTGTRGRPIFWSGCGKYLNYGLKDGFLDIEAGYLLIITSSSWRLEDVGYQHDCLPGDGIVILQIEDRGPPE